MSDLVGNHEDQFSCDTAHIEIVGNYWKCARRKDQWQVNFVTNLLHEQFTTGPTMGYHYYSPALKKWGYTGFTISFRRSVLLCHSVMPLFRQNFVSTQYLENKLTESDQILYAHQH